MNVYKVTDNKTPYCGGMAIVVANNEEEAKTLVYEIYKTLADFDAFKCDIVKELSFNNNNNIPHIVCEEFYYE